MKLPNGWYDGEIVVHDESGKPNFGLLQTAFDGSDTAAIVYFIFDAPYLGGYDIRDVPLETRRALVEAVLKDAPPEQVRFSAEFGTNPEELVIAACKLGLEGVIGKRRTSRYVTRRSPEWIKLKCGRAPGVRNRRLYRSAGRARGHRRAAAWDLRQGQCAAVRRQCRHGL